jgi:hypothetical protein
VGNGKMWILEENEIRKNNLEALLNNFNNQYDFNKRIVGIV